MDLQECRQYVTSRERLERGTFVGPMDKYKEVMAALHAGGWNITRSGPYTDRAMFPVLDLTRFLFIAECVIEREGER